MVSRIGIKILFVGDSGVGKTSIKNRLLGIEDGSISSTIGIDINSFKLAKGNIELIYNIFDIGGQKHYSSVRGIYYREPHLIVFVFDVSNSSSLLNLLYWSDEVVGNTGSNIFRAIVLGNKIDLVNTVEKDQLRYVLESLKERGIDVVGVIFVSAKNGENIRELYRMLVAEGLKGYINRLRVMRHKPSPL